MNGTAAPAKAKDTRQAFWRGTSLFPVPLGAVAPSRTAAGGGNIGQLTPIAKSGFLLKLRYAVTGSLTIGTVAGTAYTMPLWRLISNYLLQNSSNYPFRSLYGDDIWMWEQLTQPAGPFDPIVGSKAAAFPNTLSATNQNFSFVFEDLIGLNDGVNFQKFLLSAMTTSNDLTIRITNLPDALLALLQSNGLVITPGTVNMTVNVSAEYLTVPDPTKYQWPRRNIVQQVIGDSSFNAPQVGKNVINLTPISGPEFLGLGIQVVGAGGVLDPLTLAGSGISEVDIYANGTTPLMQYKLSDLISAYERRFNRSPNYGYLYLDFMDDLGLTNAMSHTARKVLSTMKYAQLSVIVTLNANFTAGVGAYINLLKRTQQAYASNK